MDRSRFNPNPLSFEERMGMADWFAKATKGNSYKYGQPFTKAIYPNQLSKEERAENLGLLDELERIVNTYDTYPLDDTDMKSKMRGQITYARNSINLL